MLESLKKLDKKFLYIVAAIIGLPIIILIVLMLIRGCSGNTTTKENYQEKMVSAATKYFEENKLLPKEEGEVVSVELDTLVKKGYIKSTEKLLKDDSCDGKVTVINNGASIEENDGGYHIYTPYLKCSDYKTKYLIDEIKKDIVSEKSGLYETSNGYVFKGDKVNNYIKFFGTIYRIVSIDNLGNLKLVKQENESQNIIWDNKYNIDTKKNDGVSIYEDSKILEYLISSYNNSKTIKKAARSHIIAHNVCIGERSSLETTLDNTIECSEVLEKQVISVLNITDFANASYDENCNDIYARSCVNYNYMYDFLYETWTLNGTSDNNYQIYTLSNGYPYLVKANSRHSYNIVIYISGNELYKSGDGSIDNPYIID